MSSPALPDWFASGIDAWRRGDVAGFLALYADDAVHEFPFAPEDRPCKLEGKAAITAYMTALPGRISFDAFEIVSAREVGDELIVEASAAGTRLPEGVPFRLDYVWFVTHRDGRLTRIRDYMNPLQLRSIA